MLDRLRWWFLRKLCPKVHVTIKVGRTLERGFMVVKIHHYYVPVAEHYSFDVERFNKPKPTPEMAIVDFATVAEGQVTPELEGYVESRSKEEMAGLLKEALKGTPMEGLDDEPQGTLPTQLPPST